MSLESDTAILLGLQPQSTERAIELLLSYIKHQHPDRYRDEESKRAAEERFKKGTELIALWRKQLDQQTSGTGGNNTSALAPFAEADLARVSIARHQADEADALALLVKKAEEVQYLEERVKSLTGDLEKLQGQLSAALNAREEVTASEVARQFQPTRRAIAAISLAGFVGVLAVLVPQVNHVVGAWLQPTGLPEWVSTTVAAVLVAVAMAMTTWYRIGANTARRVSAELTSTEGLSELVTYLTAECDTDGERYIEFGERDVARFVREKLSKEGRLTHVLARANTMGSTVVACDLLKDLLIDHLHKLQFIEPRTASDLEKRFMINSKDRRWKPPW